MALKKLYLESARFTNLKSEKIVREIQARKMDELHRLLAELY